MNQIIILISIYFIQYSSVLAQNYFNVVLPSAQKYVDGIYHPLIELSKDTLVVYTTTIFLSGYGGTSSVSKINYNGTIINVNKFLDSINPVTIMDSKKSGNDIYLAGSKFIYNDTIDVLWYAKLNSRLDTLWTKEIRTGFNSSAFYKLYKLKNSNLAFCGLDAKVNPFGSLLKSKAILLLTDSLGNKLSYLESFDSINFEIFHSLTEDANGNIYACGIVKKNDLNNDAFILKIDSSGKLIWKIQIPSPDYNEGLLDLFIQQDGSLLLIGDSGNSDFFGDKFTYTLLINMNVNGSINWIKRIMKVFAGETEYCVEDDSGNYICAGSIISEQGKNSDGYLIKFSSQGDSIWSHTFNKSDIFPEQFFNISKAFDGGYYLTGLSFINGINTSKGWIVKVDSNGCVVPGCITGVNVESELHSKGFELYPNPTRDLLNIYFNSKVSMEIRIELFDLQGHKLVSEKIHQGADHYKLDVNDLATGIYLLRLRDKKGIFGIEKVVIE